MHYNVQINMTQEEDIKNAVKVLKEGGVILYPTDTVWGIGCDATNPEAVAKVYKIKHRDDSKALICLVDSDARLQRYVRNVPAGLGSARCCHQTDHRYPRWCREPRS